MTEQERENDLEHSGLTIDDHVAPDLMLKLLQALANNVGFEMGMTVVVSGSVISGTLISGRTYFNSIAAVLEADGGDAAKPIVQVFRSEADEYADLSKGPIEDDERDEREVGFIHLRDAEMVHPGKRVNLRFWRGRLASVDGWTLGRFDPISDRSSSDIEDELG